MATLVTGGTGFVGSNLVKVLAEKGHDVVSLDIAPPNELVRQYLDPVSSRVEWVQADIADAGSLSNAIAGHAIDKIVHMAVYTAIQDEVERAHSRTVIDVNVVGTANLLDFARDTSIGRFIYVGSGGSYAGSAIAPTDRPIHEDYPQIPKGLYSITKYASELMTTRYGELHDFSTAVVRIGGPYGPMERPTGHRAVMGVMCEWTGNAIRGEEIQVAERARGDFTYVLDIAEGIRVVLDASHLPHLVYNNTRGVGYNVDEVVEAFQKALPSAKFVQPVLKQSRIRAAGLSRPRLDSSRIQDLGMVYKYDLVSGVKAYMQWRSEFGEIA